MSKIKQKILDNFEDFHEAIHRLFGHHDVFDDLCHRYSRIDDRLQGLSEDDPERSALLRRQNEVEQEMLAVMGHDRRV